MIEGPLKVDPNYYKLKLENNQVRVLRINYGPRRGIAWKSSMV